MWGKMEKNLVSMLRENSCSQKGIFSTGYNTDKIIIFSKKSHRMKEIITAKMEKVIPPEIPDSLENLFPGEVKT